MNARLKKLFSSFSSAHIDALLVSSWPNVSYLSGFRGTESWIFVTPDKGLYFITDSRYSEQAEREAPDFKLILRDKKGVAEIVADVAKKKKFRKIGFESPAVTFSFFQSLEKQLGADRLVPTKGLVETLREIKDLNEVDLLRKSAAIAVRGFRYLKESVRPGSTERDAQARVEYFTKTLGAEKPAFDIIIATGARSSMPHCQTNETRIENNTILLVDMGVLYEAYNSDLTRPIFLGKIPPLLQKITDIVRAAQREGIKKAAPGVPVREVDAACRTTIRKKGYGDFFGHGTGHGVGLEIHEAPNVSSRSGTVLRPGMVITVEPGIYLPGKYGVRIEDTLLITKKGNEILTDGLDKPV